MRGNSNDTSSSCLNNTVPQGATNSVVYVNEKIKQGKIIPDTKVILIDAEIVPELNVSDDLERKDKTDGQLATQYQAGYEQTAYFQQVQVHCAFVQSPPPPADASRSPSARRGQNDDYHVTSGDPIFMASFDDAEVRKRFIQRVYMILTVQLLYTTTFIALCIFEPNIKYYITHHNELLYVASFTQLTFLIVLYCCTNVRRTYPLNFIFLAIFTISFAYITAVVSAFYSTYTVLMSIGVTTIVCLLVSLFATKTSWDITTCGICLCVTSLVFIPLAILVIVFARVRIIYMIYCGIATLLFCIYLMYDTQMIMGGRRIELSPEEYICGALSLYIDIMNIFIYLLSIFGDYH